MSLPIIIREIDLDVITTATTGTVAINERSRSFPNTFLLLILSGGCCNGGDGFFNVVLLILCVFFNSINSSTDCLALVLLNCIRRIGGILQSIARCGFYSCACACACLLSRDEFSPNGIVFIPIGR